MEPQQEIEGFHGGMCPLEWVEEAEQEARRGKQHQCGMAIARFGLGIEGNCDDSKLQRGTAADRIRPQATFMSGQGLLLPGTRIVLNWRSQPWGQS